MASMNAATEIKITKLRLQLHRNGFDPLPAYEENRILPSRVPPSAKIVDDEQEIHDWTVTYDSATSTAIDTTFTPVINIDFSIKSAAEMVEAAVREHFEEHGDIYVCSCRPPRRFILLRTDEPFTKLSRVLIAPDGSQQTIEVFGDG